MKSTRIFFRVASLWLAGVSLPGFGALLPGPPSLASLQKQADVIAVATLDSIDDSQGFEAVQLSVTRIIQGQPGSLSIRALIPSPQTPTLGGSAPAKIGLVPTSGIGSSGVWFLKNAVGGWQVIPLDSGTYQQLYTSFPVDSTLPVPTGTVSQQLLAYLVRWYQSIPYPTHVDQDFRFFGGLDGVNPTDAATAIAPLLASPRADLYGLGLAASIRLGSPGCAFKCCRECHRFAIKSETAADHGCHSSVLPTPRRSGYCPTPTDRRATFKSAGIGCRCRRGTSKNWDEGCSPSDGSPA